MDESIQIEFAIHLWRALSDRNALRDLFEWGWDNGITAGQIGSAYLNALADQIGGQR